MVLSNDMYEVELKIISITIYWSCLKSNIYTFFPRKFDGRIFFESGINLFSKYISVRERVWERERKKEREREREKERERKREKKRERERNILES